MNKKQRRLKSRLAQAIALCERQDQLIKDQSGHINMLQETNFELRRAMQDSQEQYLWTLARYRWVDQVLQDALRSFPGHPLQQLISPYIEVSDPHPYDYWDVAVLPKLLPYSPNISEQIRDIAADIIRHYALRYDFRWNEYRGQAYVRVTFNGKGIGYFCPKGLRGMPPQEKFNLVMRELTPVVIQLLEHD